MRMHYIRRKPVYMQKFIGAMVSEFRVFKDNEEHGNSDVYIPVFRILCDIFIQSFAWLLFYMFSTFMSLEDI